ncbi:MAG TPA: hypothetical protein VL984_02730 [Acidimicrobiales bacterium]|nr:hypothetical protein [Acidimicrobiales bacterium]
MTTAGSADGAGGGPLAGMTTLGAIGDLRSVPPSSSDRTKVNSHVHVPPNFSAFSAVGDAVAAAAEQGIGVLGVGNYYDFNVYGPLAAHAASNGIFPLFGTEVVCLVPELQRSGERINDPANPGKMYFCGKGITRFSPMTPAAETLMGTVRSTDSARMAAMIAKLAVLFAAIGVETSLTEETLKARVAERAGVPPGTVWLQERHVAQAFQEALSSSVPAGDLPSRLCSLLGTASSPQLDAASVQDAIRSHLMKTGKPAYVEEHFISFEQAYQLVLALGGVPCYPVLADGAKPVCEFEASISHLVEWFQQKSIHCAEVIPRRNAADVLEAYVQALRSAGIMVLAGTEHNTPEMIPMEPACVGGVPIPAHLQEIFWEGACVAAAHQFATAKGADGYVRPDGALGNGELTREEHIAAFARLGAGVIGKYATTHGSQRDK